MLDEITAPLFVTEWGRRAGIVTIVLLFSLILLVCTISVTQWQKDFILSKKSSGALAMAHSENIVKLIEQIPSEHVFGKAGAQGLPITSLQLRLLGIIKAVPNKYSRVIISEKNQPGKVYQVGDILSSGIRVYEINDDSVVLDNGGNLETLPLERPSLEFQGMPKSLLNNDVTPEE